MKINLLKVKRDKNKKGLQICNPLISGPDGTRTRDLRRDRAAF